MVQYTFNKSYFDKHGFCKIKSFFTNKELKQLKYKVKRFVNTKAKNLNGRNINFTKNREINTLHDIDKFENQFKVFASKKKNLKLASFFLDSQPEFRKCEIFAKPAKKGMPSPLHQDNFLWGIKNNNGVTFWIALEKSSKKNGALHYISGSHKLGLLKHKNSYAPGTSQTVDEKLYKRKLSKLKKITPTLNAGDMLIHHCLTVHGSNQNKSKKSRVGLTIQYKDKKSKYDKKILSYYEKNLVKQLKLRKHN